MTTRAFARAFALTLALLAVVATGCGDNRVPAAAPQADAGAAPDGAPFTPSSIEFVPDDGDHAGALWLELAEARPAEKLFKLRVVGDGLDAHGVAGRLLFDVSVTELGGIAGGDALAGGDAQIVVASAGNRQGGYFGVSRTLGERVAVPLTDAAPVATLDFVVTGPGATPIRFNAPRSLVLDADAKPVEVTAWLGGTLTVK
jgi:hypothetical protein